MAVIGRDKFVSDDTYERLGAVGSESNELASFCAQWMFEAEFGRSPYVGDMFQLMDESENLYLYGRHDAGPGDSRVTVNRVQNTLNTFTANATKTNATIQVKSASINEEGYWVMLQDFQIQHPLNPNDTRPLKMSQRLDYWMLDHVPPELRVEIGTKTVEDFQQSLFDFKRTECGMNDTIREIVHTKQQWGWVMGLFSWDTIDQMPQFDIYKPQQWFPDPIKYDVAKMNVVRLDLVCDAREAERRFPKLARFIRANASKTVYRESGVPQYSNLYQTNTFRRPVITLAIMWLRNQEAPMTLQEALDTGMVVEGDPDALPPESEGEVTPVGDDGGETKRTITHAQTGEDMSDSWDEDGNPRPATAADAKDENGQQVNVPLRHENHPMKLVNRQYIVVRGKVAPGSDVICPHWDFPIFLDKNTPINGRPYGQPETERLRSPQQTINNVQTSMVDHVAHFRTAAGFIDRSIVEKISPKFEGGFMTAGMMYTYDGSGNPEDDIRKHILWQDPPPMPEAMPKLKADISREYELVAGNPGVDQGTPPPGVDSGIAIAHLQSQSQAAQSFKSMFTERCIWRMSKLKLHAELHWMKIKEIMRITRRYPQQIVEEHIQPFARRIAWDVIVSLPTGAGMIKAQRDAQIRQDVVTAGADGQPLIDIETARDELEYPHDEIERRLKHQREINAPDSPPPPKESATISIKFETLTPEVQAQVFKTMGIDVQPGQAATLPPTQPTTGAPSPSGGPTPSGPTPPAKPPVVPTATTGNPAPGPTPPMQV